MIIQMVLGQVCENKKIKMIIGDARESLMTSEQKYDIIFSALIAGMLGGIAFYLGWANMQFLADIRDPDAEQVFRELLTARDAADRFVSGIEAEAAVLPGEHLVSFLPGEEFFPDESFDEAVAEQFDKWVRIIRDRLLKNSTFLPKPA